jgi:hypothetical protein
MVMTGLVSRRSSRSALRSALLAASAGAIISAVSYFVSDSPIRIWLPRIGAYGSAIVHGFPIPYFAYFPDNGPSQLYFPLNFAGDVAIWLAISFLVVSTFTLRRLVAASICGIVVTLSTLFLSPLALSTPNDANLESTGAYMGFPSEYLTRFDVGILDFTHVAYVFSLTHAIADYLLWFGVTFSVIGLLALVGSKARTSKPPRFDTR